MVTPKSFRVYVVHIRSMKNVLSQTYICINLYCAHSYRKVYFLLYVLIFLLYSFYFIFCFVSIL